MYTKKVLKNGLTILKVPLRGSRSVLVDVFVKVGSRSEDKKLNGVSHFLEHLFFKGSKNYPTAMSLSHALDAIGADYNANTGKEHTQFYIKAAKKHLKYIFEILTDVLQNPVMDQEEIDREKGVILEEISMYEDTPIRHVDDLLEEQMWPDQPLGRNIAGTKEIIKKITRKDIVKYMNTYYQPCNMIVCISGAVADGTFDKLIQKYWSPLKNTRLPKWKKAKQPSGGAKIYLKEKQTEQYHLAMGFYGHDYNDKKNIPMAVLSSILGGGMSSRLFTEVRERRGLAYYVKSGESNYQDTGNFVIKAGVRLDALEDAIKIIVAELKKLKSEKVSAQELHKVKEYIKGTAILALENHDNLLGWYLEQAAFHNKIVEPEDFLEKIDQVTENEVQQLAREIFNSDNVALTVIGPKNNRKLLQSILRI